MLEHSHGIFVKNILVAKQTTCILYKGSYFDFAGGFIAANLNDVYRNTFPSVSPLNEISPFAYMSLQEKF